MGKSQNKGEHKYPKEVLCKKFGALCNSQDAQNCLKSMLKSNFLFFLFVTERNCVFL